jgi:signal transduction histidine kinase
MEVAQLYLWEYDVKDRKFIFNEKLWAFLGNEESTNGIYTLKPEEFAETYIYSKDLHIFENSIKEAYEPGDPDYSSQVEYRIVRKDGQIRHLLVRIRVRMGSNSFPSGFFGIIQDITERKIEIQKSFDALNQVDNAKTEFLYFISQEIRTPLNGVVGAVNLIKNQENSAAVRDLVETLDKSVSTLESFTNNAVLYTKLTNNYIPELSTFRVKDLIQFALLEKENFINEKDIRINFEENESDHMLKGDKDLLYKLFLNILDIFITNSSSHNNIRIGIMDDTEKVCCSFYDSKNKFPDDLLKSYKSITGIYQNCQMGLGLYIVKLITDKHKGELHIFNDGDSMATAIFHFPK